jgi:hypothetical protein
MTLDEPQSWSGHHDIDKNHCPCQELNPEHPAHSQSLYWARRINLPFSETQSLYVRLKHFTATECNEILGDQPCENGVVIQRFRECLCLHHQGWCDILMMEQSLWNVRLEHHSYMAGCPGRLHCTITSCHESKLLEANILNIYECGN